MNPPTAGAVVLECEVIMRRVPQTVTGEPIEDHAFYAACGRPVERDGMCPYHLKQSGRDELDERRRWNVVARFRSG